MSPLAMAAHPLIDRLFFEATSEHRRADGQGIPYDWTVSDNAGGYIRYDVLPACY
jgi:hypothetical protein